MGSNAKLEPMPEFFYNGMPVSALGYRLLKIRERIDAAAERGEIKLLNREELERLFEEDEED